MKAPFDGFDGPNTTPVPDIVFDELLGVLTGNELKVLLYIVRRTYGFGKNADAISLSQFREGITTQDGKVLDKGCGIKHNRTILAALEVLEKKKYIIATKRKTAAGDKDTTTYKLNLKKAYEATSEASSLQQVVTPRNQVVTPGNDGSYPTSLPSLPGVTTVVTPGNIQETVLQETVLQETVLQESIPSTEAITKPVAPPIVVASHTLLSEESPSPEEQEVLIDAPGLQEDFSSQQKSAKKPRTPKAADETLKVRIERVYGYFDKLAQETSGDATYRYQRTKKATAAITEWLKGTPTEELLREVYLELWNTPVDPRSSFDWKQNMHIHSVLAQYDSRVLAIKAKRKPAPPPPLSIVNRSLPDDDDGEELNYRPPSSQRNKTRPPYHAARRA